MSDLLAAIRAVAWLILLWEAGKWLLAEWVKRLIFASARTETTRSEDTR